MGSQATTHQNRIRQDSPGLSIIPFTVNINEFCGRGRRTNALFCNPYQRDPAFVFESELISPNSPTLFAQKHPHGLIRSLTHVQFVLPLLGPNLFPTEHQLRPADKLSKPQAVISTTIGNLPSTHTCPCLLRDEGQNAS